MWVLRFQVPKNWVLGIWAIGTVALLLKILHDLGVLHCYNSQGRRYRGSCKIFSIHRSTGFGSVRHLCRGGSEIRCWHQAPMKNGSGFARLLNLMPLSALEGPGTPKTRLQVPNTIQIRVFGALNPIFGYWVP